MNPIFKYGMNLRTTLLLMLLSTALLPGCKKDSPGDDPEVSPPRYTESVSFRSNIINTEVKFSVYLPADYSKEKDTRYGTVYLLHGWGDNETAWMTGGKIDAIINRLEESGQIDPMIYVMPQGYTSYYVNQYDGKFNYMKMFTEELVPYIDSYLRTKTDARHRAVMGYSMGGYGALILPYMNPDLFSISVPLSMSWRTHEQYCSEPQSVWDSQWGRIFGGVGKSGMDRLTDYYLARDPFTFFDSKQQSASNLDLFMDCGDDEEQLSVAAVNLHDLMRDRNIPHQMRVRNGAHTWDYWRSGATEALPYISERMNDRSYSEVTKATRFASSVSGTRVQRSLNGATLAITTPSGYESSDVKFNTVYLAYDDYANRNSESEQIGLLLDSLQRKKEFILISFDPDELAATSTNFEQVVAYIDANFRTGTKDYNRVLIGNRNAGSFLWTSTDRESALTHAAFFFDTQTPQPTGTLRGAYYYVATGDLGTNHAAASALYLACRQQNVEHQYRILNGTDGFDTFLYLLQESISTIGLKLNKH